MPICTACASISTWREMVVIKSSRRESSSAGVRSVRSWIRTSCRRSLALSALFFFPNKRSKKFMATSSLPIVEDVAIIHLYDQDRGRELSHPADALQCYGRLVRPCFWYQRPQERRDSNQ